MINKECFLVSLWMTIEHTGFNASFNFFVKIRSLRRMCDIDYDLALAQRLLQSGGTSNKLSFLLTGSGVGAGTGSANLEISSPQQTQQQIPSSVSTASNISSNSLSSTTSDSVNSKS